ncbi:helix-turn-helix domain-containing protein [Ottowia sp.]|uniref:GlxA family transcriptional regulator n=1 Tax=Ottowia sp. TaxID=1898956 RepID=UPI0025D14FA5|nr:helix-turn-helix domain-containing protein [Ottowia sp.]MBK6613949.1 helix-turn-helix domain-containing protein [Ottowia sp.]
MPRPSPSSPRTPPHRVVCLAFPGVMSLDVLGPLQVFATANDLRRKHGLAPRYRVEVAGPRAGVVLTSAGIGLMATRAWAAVRGGADCTVLVPGGDGIDAAVRETPLLAVLQRLAPRVGRLGSVCSGALALGQAGLLDGVLATTHWSRAEQLRQCAPRATLDADRLHTFDAAHPVRSRRFTSAGVTAGIDLALALVEADCGRPLALAVARQLVMFMRRPGGQAQFSPLLAPEPVRAPRLARLLDWIPGQIGSNLTVDALAAQARLAPRTLARAFAQELGTTPGRYVEQVRLEAATALLGQRQASIATVARLCGFGHPDTLRRSFQRRMAISPRAFAERFGLG